MSKHEVLLLENIHPSATEVFERNGFVVHTRTRSLGEDDLIEALQGMSMVGIRSNTKVTDKVLASTPDLRAIGAFCIGTNQIDLGAAAERGIAAFRSGEIELLVVSKVANFSIDLPGAAVAIQVSGSFGSRQEEAQRLGRLLRPKEDGKTARFYTIVSRDTVDADFAQNRQRFLAEQGYAYRIVDAGDL